VECGTKISEVYKYMGVAEPHSTTGRGSMVVSDLYCTPFVKPDLSWDLVYLNKTTEELKVQRNDCNCRLLVYFPLYFRVTA
jgi:hypothetical protein